MRLEFWKLFILCVVVVSARSRRKRNAEAVAEMAGYFAKYYQLHNAMDGVVKTGYSSADGRRHYEFERLPSFVERVLELESQAGLNETGRITEELLREAKKARCGVSDPPTDVDDAGAFVVKSMWESKYVPKKKLYVITFSIVDSSRLPYYLKWAELEEGLLSAMCLWESNSNVRFKNIGADDLKADITIRFASGQHGDWYSFDGSGGTLAHAFYPENGRLHFDLEESWYLARKGRVDLRKKDIFTVAAHELGHSIGLMHSAQRGALMAPIYKFAGSIKDYRLPRDDVKGVVNIYGTRVASNPADETGTACYNLKKNYGIASDNLVTESEESKPKKRKRVCQDDPRYRKYCPRWLSAGFCDHADHGKTLRRRCKKTCGFCPVKPMFRKPKKSEDVSLMSHSVCSVDRFDAISVSFDSRNVLSMHYFKDGYYFESSILSGGDIEEVPNMLDSSEDMADGIPWRTDPKSIKVGSFLVKHPDMFSMTTEVDAVALTKSRYLVFEKETGIIQEYSAGTPTVVYIGNYTIQQVYRGYPHYKVDAAIVEFNVGPNNETIHSLFYEENIWQFKELKNNENSSEENPKLRLEPSSLKQGVPIQQWHGVPACNIDSVFQYKGIPYFVKGSIFWPAVDTEPLIPRDLTYNFLRCWEEEPFLGPNPPTCAAAYDSQTAGKIGDGNSATSTRLSLTATAILLTWIFAHLGETV